MNRSSWFFITTAGRVDAYLTRYHDKTWGVVIHSTSGIAFARQTPAMGYYISAEAAMAALESVWYADLSA